MVSYKILESINTSSDIKNLTDEQLIQLSSEIRRYLIGVISKNGGHLASSLGVVELTLALHNVFDLPKDKIVWDVGHQSYTHKIITGRREQFKTIRTENGLSGFPKSCESEFDAFVSGHSSTSISAALGIAEGEIFKKSGAKTIAVIGDGALSGGLAYEGLNNAGRHKGSFIVILNDNEMSISKNVGSMAKYLSIVRSRPGYFKFKDFISKSAASTPIIGKPINDWLKKSKSILKEAIYNSTFFEDMGFVYMGPVDGHNFEQLKSVLERAKSLDIPVFIHVQTTKGKGYPFAEQNPGAFHGVSKFDVKSGKSISPSKDTNFSEVFGKKLAELAEKDDKICAITAAMKYGTGLQHFYSKFKDRFFDVGIAEQHATTFAAGLSSCGMKPVFAVYSTFLQRGYDQIMHDCAIEKRHVVFAVDRAGVVGEDGETHQGLFDVAYLSTVPGMVIYSPSNYFETELSLERALNENNGVVAIRYPRGSEVANINPEHNCENDYKFIKNSEKQDNLIISYGRLTYNAISAAKILKEKNINADVLKLVKIQPINKECLSAINNYKNVFFVEEGIKNGSIAQQMLELLIESGFKGNYKIRAVDNMFVQQASVASSLAHLGLDEDSIANFVIEKGC